MPSKLSASCSQNQMLDGPSWSTPSASPSPPPPPLPPPVAARWARTEQVSNDSCPHCRGRLASLPTRTTSLSSYSCKDRSTPIPRPPEDEDSFPVLHDRELHSLHRNVPALRRRDVDTATIRQHYYPEGGWGWLVCGAAFLAHLLTSGIQLAFGLLYLYTMNSLLRKKSDRDIYAMGTESDKILPSDRPQFNTELVWEVEKKDLRKIRSANQPLRVECVTMDSQNRKERVGFALLSLRSAQIIPLKNANQELSLKWHKLIGCQTDKKQCHPELYLSLVVRDHLINEVEPSNSVEQMPYISEEDPSLGEDTFNSFFPVVYLDDGYIQVGKEENATATFSLNLLVEEVVSLDTLLPEILVFQQNKEKYYLSFRILGVTIKTKPFKRELHNTIVLNEKIVVKLLSDQNTLRDFFKTQNVTVNFCCGQDKLGTTTVELTDVFTIKQFKCFFKFPSPNGIVPYGSNEKSPFISIKGWIEQDSIPEPKIEKEEDKPKTKMVFSNIPKLPSCGGDEPDGSYILDKLEKIDVKAQSDSEPPTKDVTPPFITKSVDTVVKNIPLSPKMTGPFDVYKKYVLEVSLKSLIWKNSPKDTKIIFKFLHPKASSYITIFTELSDAIGELIQLNNLNINFFYLSTQEKAVNLLNAWPPKLVLMDEKERSLNEEYEFTAVFSTNFCIEKDVILRTARSLEPLAKLKVVLTLNEFHLGEDDTHSSLTLLPVVLDEIICVKEVKDIEKWKSKQRDRFDEELEKIKEKELSSLQKEWEKKKSKIEEQLLRGVNKCKKLQENLQNKVNSFKIEKSLIRRRNSGTIMYEEFFKENWRQFGLENSKEVIELLSKTQRDNEHLKQMIVEHKQRLQAVEKSTLTKTQTTNLLRELRVLEEKFEEAQTAKMYFKDQWKKACDEIHDMKREDILNLKNHIQHSKEQLSQLSLEKYTSSPIDNTGNCSPSSIVSGMSSSLFM